MLLVFGIARQNDHTSSSSLALLEALSTSKGGTSARLITCTSSIASSTCGSGLPLDWLGISIEALSKLAQGGTLLSGHLKNKVICLVPLELLSQSQSFLS